MTHGHKKSLQSTYSELFIFSSNKNNSYLNILLSNYNFYSPHHKWVTTAVGWASLFPCYRSLMFCFQPSHHKFFPPQNLNVCGSQNFVSVLQIVYNCFVLNFPYIITIDVGSLVMK